MLELARFYGIVIAVDDGETLAGSMHPTGLRLVRQWGRLHRPELMNTWDTAMAGRTPARIEPLK